MKFSIVIAIACLVGFAAAQATPGHEGRQLAEALSKRAEALITSTKAVLAELYKQGKGHLASSIEHQIVLVEALALDLKASLANATKEHSVHHVHVIEEDLNKFQL